MPFLYQTFFNFRNLKNDTLDLSNREIFFVGENGQGKSNILESLYYTSYGVSFRTHVDSQIVKTGEKDFSINALYKKSEEASHKISVIFENGKKRIEKNGKKIQDRKELINTIPCILFCHDDLRFATGEPEARRFFIDQSLTLYDSTYIDDLRNYKKILKHKSLKVKYILILFVYKFLQILYSRRLLINWSWVRVPPHPPFKKIIIARVLDSCFFVAKISF